VGDDVDVQSARAPALVADAVEGLLDRVCPLQQGGRGQGGLEDDDGVEVGGLAARLDAPRLGLVDGGDGLDAQARGVLQRVHGALEGLQAVAEVGAEGDHGALRVVQGGVGGVDLLDDGGGYRLYGRV